MMAWLSWISALTQILLPVLPYFSSPAFLALKAQPIFHASALLASSLSVVIFNAIAVAFYSIVRNLLDTSTKLSR